ncbi:unnamed protein product [Hymenolepis diminuta]|uniref:DUF663 domain-containing protein n=1 Tax=Hymenolepis diminuta TaxID=6216 RepID=A0A0R3SMF3_HYMDI|nr:unnamed protein product [Hymenolepis diminuta]
MDIINEPPYAPHAHGRPCFVTRTREALFNVHEVARRRLFLTAHGPPYQVRDLVMYTTTPPLSVCNKLYRPWDGPYIIRMILNDATCKTR